MPVPDVRIRALREAFSKAADKYDFCWVCLTIPESEAWPESPHWFDIVHPDKLESDTWNRQIWGLVLGQSRLGSKQPILFEMYAGWAIVFYDSEGVPDKPDWTYFEGRMKEARARLDELANEATICFGIEIDSDVYLRSSKVSYDWLRFLFRTLNPPRNAHEITSRFVVSASRRTTWMM